MGVIAVWISLIVGLICLMWGWNFARWLGPKLVGREWDTGVAWTAGPLAGTPVTYFELEGGTAWGETGFFVMGVALLLDAALLAAVHTQPRPTRGLLRPALGATILALAFNVGVCVYYLGLGFKPYSNLIAVLVGGIMLFDQIALWREAWTPSSESRAGSLESQ